MHADDLVLLSSSVYDLQCLLDICSSTADSLSLKFKCQKSCWFAFGTRYSVIEPMNLGIGVIDWCSNIKYLRVLIKSARHLVTDIDVTVRKFYMSYNAVFSNCNCIDELIGGVPLQRIPTRSNALFPLDRTFCFRSIGIFFRSSETVFFRSSELSFRSGGNKILAFFRSSGNSDLVGIRSSGTFPADQA